MEHVFPFQLQSNSQSREHPTHGLTVSARHRRNSTCASHRHRRHLLVTVTDDMCFSPSPDDIWRLTMTRRHSFSPSPDDIGFSPSPSDIGFHQRRPLVIHVAKVTHKVRIGMPITLTTARFLQRVVILNCLHPPGLHLEHAVKAFPHTHRTTFVTVCWSLHCTTRWAQSQGGHVLRDDRSR